MWKILSLAQCYEAVNQIKQQLVFKRYLKVLRKDVEN